MTLAVQDLSLRFGGVLAIDQMSISVCRAETVGLIGPNGAGKSTLINCISGNVRAQQGHVKWDATSLVGLAPHEIIRLGVVRTFQNVASLHDLTVLDIVKLGHAMRPNAGKFGFAKSARAKRSQDEELTESVLTPLRLADLAHRPLQSLSYGLRKAVDLARAIAAQPKLLLLDEPVAGLTQQESLAMSRAIAGVRELIGCAIVMVEHKMDVVNSVCDRVVVMAAGAKIFEGTAAEVQADREVRRVYLGEP